MKQVVNKWLGRYFGSDEAVLLAVMIAAFVVLVATVGTFLGPVFTALIIAFLLQGELTLNFEHNESDSFDQNE